MPPRRSRSARAYKRALPDGVPFDVLLDKPDGDDNIGAIAAAWGIKAVPESALIDKQGNIRALLRQQARLGDAGRADLPALRDDE